jgi:hypothetical protein
MTDEQAKGKKSDESMGAIGFDFLIKDNFVFY